MKFLYIYNNNYGFIKKGATIRAGALKRSNKVLLSPVFSAELLIRFKHMINGHTIEYFVFS